MMTMRIRDPIAFAGLRFNWGILYSSGLLEILVGLDGLRLRNVFISPADETASSAGCDETQH